MPLKAEESDDPWLLCIPKRLAIAALARFGARRSALLCLVVSFAIVKQQRLDSKIVRAQHPKD